MAKKPAQLFPALDRSQPELVQAASLGLAVLKFAKVQSWAELGGELPFGLVIGDDEVELLRRHVAMLTYLRVSTPLPKPADAAPEDRPRHVTVSIAVCPQCGRWLLCEGQPPSTCLLTLTCSGVPVKATPAKNVPPNGSDDAVQEALLSHA